MTTQPDGWQASNGTEIFARAMLRHAGIMEEYFVQQDISENSSTRHGGPPAGRIELELPYDGHRFLTRDAQNDVALGLAAHPEGDGTAVIGHLLLRNYANTDLADSLGLSGQHEAVPIRVPTGGEPDGDRLGRLIADRQTCITRYEFVPRTPALIPATLDISLLDPDRYGSGMPPVPLRSDDGRTAGDLIDQLLGTPAGRRYVTAVRDRIRQPPSFEDGLTLCIVVKLTVPAKTMPAKRGDRDGLEPVITRVAIDWPAITYPRTIHLRVPYGQPGPEAGAGRGELPVRYNPFAQRIEWCPGPETIWATKKSSPAGGEVRYFESAPMYLSMSQPAVLYAQAKLHVQAEIQVPGYLLSGLQARVYDARGYIRQKPPVDLVTKIHPSATLILDDAFAKREFSPSQHLFFDEVIPDKARVTDIIAALRDRGFDAREAWAGSSGGVNDAQLATTSWLLVAHRQHGPDDMLLWILVEGSTFMTERRTEIPGGEVEHLTDLPSGELRLFIHGTLARDSNDLTHEINALQSRLREQFSRVRQRR
jgi:hypothetical protein